MKLLPEFVMTATHTLSIEGTALARSSHLSASLLETATAMPKRRPQSGHILTAGSPTERTARARAIFARDDSLLQF